MRKHIRERQAFIKKTLETNGTVNRVDIMKQFEVGSATAAIDLRKFREINPGFMVYSAKEKTYKKSID